MNEFPYHLLEGSKPLPDLGDPKLSYQLGLQCHLEICSWVDLQGVKAGSELTKACHYALRACAYSLHLITTLADFTN